MAALTTGAKKVLTETPWLMVEWPSVVSVAASGTLAHGEGRAPDVVFLVQTSANPVASNYAVTATDATNITVDFEDDGNDSYSLYAIWFSQSSGGLTNVS